MFSWVCDHPLKCAKSTQGHTLKKCAPPTSPGICQFPVAPQLGVGFHDHLPDPMLGLCLALTYTGLEHAVTTSVSLYVQLTYNVYIQGSQEGGVLQT